VSSFRSRPSLGPAAAPPRPSPCSLPGRTSPPRRLAAYRPRGCPSFCAVELRPVCRAPPRLWCYASTPVATGRARPDHHRLRTRRLHALPPSVLRRPASSTPVGPSSTRHVGSLHVRLRRGERSTELWVATRLGSILHSWIRHLLEVGTVHRSI
jgi:hypothetical protein